MQGGWSPGWRLLWLKVFLLLVQRPVTTEDSNTPGLAVELVRMCRQYFTTGFATESSMTSQSKTHNDLHLLPGGGGGGTPIYN